MTERKDILRLIQSHKAINHFDYDLAINLIKQGKETDNVLMLASFSKPVDRLEIRPYVTAVLGDLKLKELEGNEAVIAKAHYHLTEILDDNSTRKNLHFLYQLCLDNDHELGLMGFYLLYHGWHELEDIGVNYYYDDANLENIEEALKKEAILWIEKYIDRKEEKAMPITPIMSERIDSGRESNSMLKRLWSRLRK